MIWIVPIRESVCLPISQARLREGPCAASQGRPDWIRGRPVMIHVLESYYLLLRYSMARLA